MGNDSKEILENKNDNDRNISSLASGDIVLTSFGAGVVTQIKNENEVIKVRLWRVPFQSIASTAVAFLRRDAIIQFLPAAPGMTSHIDADLITNADIEDEVEENKEESKVMVHCYSAHSDTFIVSLMNDSSDGNDNLLQSMQKSATPATMTTEETKSTTLPLEFITLNASQLKKSRASKFYPLIEDLMKRADKAVLSTKNLVSNSSIQKLVATSSEIIKNAASTSSNNLTKEKIDSVSTSVSNTIKSGIPLPDEQQIMEIYTMMKDEDLTVLLKKGQARLQQLVSNKIPQAVENALKKSGIEIKSDDDDSTSSGNSSSTSLLSRSTILASRAKALDALNDLLSEHASTDLDEIKTTLGNEFSTVFDTLSTAAKSDHRLNSIFDNLSDKTTEWQEATGRLRATKSASLFLEGTQRLKARAANLLSPEQLLKAKGAGMKFTKAFMEGDAAVARLKSIELGDEIRSRLVKMIEMRSGSQGGLDGIIAGALTSISDKAADKVSQENIQTMLFNLQQTASSSTKKAHETLLGALSRESKFREAAILRIEVVLVSLENQLGSDISAEEIAKITKGESGTSALFEPIARRAAEEIEKQLDAVETKLTDKVSMSVLAKIREIIAGKLTMSTLLDEAVSVLNDEKVVAHGEKLVKYGESVLNAIEKQSSNKNKVVGGVMQFVEKAGLSKDSLMRNVENLDINKLLNSAETAVTNEEARKEMLSSAGDTALDFLLRILPSMDVPPFDGVREGLVYNLSNLSMKGFKVKKENIFVEIAGIRATKTSENKSPDETELSTENSMSLEDGDNEMLVDFPHHASVLNDPSFDDLDGRDILVDFPQNNRIGDNQQIPETEQRKVKATEVLIIDVRDISAVLEDAAWSFEQTFFPYLKGSGKSFVNLLNGSIRLQFELRKRRVNIDDGEDVRWEPVFCLHHHSCTIGQVELKLLGEGRILWILNKIAAYLKLTLRDYVVRTIMDLLKRQSGVLLRKLNNALKNFWGIILQTSGLVLDNLEEISESDLVDAVPDQYANEVELVWREHVPLGLNLLMNDDSGLLKVVDLPRGSQARKVAIEKNLDPDAFNGAKIISVNGTRYDGNSQLKLIDALRDPGRPKSVSFELASATDVEHIQSIIKEMNDENKQNDNATEAEAGETLNLKTVNIVKEGPIGIRFSSSTDGLGLRIDEFLKDENDQSVVSELNNTVSVGDVLFSINDVYVFGENSKENAFHEFQKSGLVRPLSLVFSSPYLHLLTIMNSSENDSDDTICPSDELCFEERKSATGVHQIYLKEFINISGAIESNGVYLGDHLVKINGSSVGIGVHSDHGDLSPSLENIHAYLANAKSYPVTLTFARPRKDRSRWDGVLKRPNEDKSKKDSTMFELENFEKVIVTISSSDELGCLFGIGQEASDIIVIRFYDVPGKFQKQIKDEGKNFVGMSVEAINGQVVPSYSNAFMVTNAIQTTWSENDDIEITFCNEQRKEWLFDKLIEK